MVLSKNFEIIELVGGNSASVTAAARTICRAFSEDPLIKWLRPNATPWSALSPQTMLWQQRRVDQTSNLNKVFVFRDKNTAKDEHEEIFPAVAFLEPPETNWAYYIASFGSRIWFTVLDYLWPVPDEEAKIQRVNVMMENHERGKNIIEDLANQPAWYIEVVAVDPSYQGLKLGSKMIKHLLSQCPTGDPVYLECTDEKNVGFYEKFGFKVIHEVRLKDPSEESDKGINLWLMGKL